MSASAPSNKLKRIRANAKAKVRAGANSLSEQIKEQ